MSKSRKIRKEEKLTIVKQCLSGEIGIYEAGRQMGVVQESIRRWIIDIRQKEKTDYRRCRGRRLGLNDGKRH